MHCPHMIAVAITIGAAFTHGSVAEDKCITTLQKDCSNATTKKDCGSCAKQHEQELYAAGCTKSEVEDYCSGSGPAPAPPGVGMPLVLLPGTHCLDGSPAGYYYAAPNTSSKTWVIFLKGGGACFTNTGPGDTNCLNRAKDKLGSSTKWESTYKPEGDGHDLMSSDKDVNPGFYDAHHVFINYCSGDGHQGTRNTTNDWGLYFSGHINFVAIINDLIGKGMSSATHVLLGGESAGASGTFHNADWLTDRLGSSVVVKATPNAGWFFPSALPPNNWPGHPDYPVWNYSCYTGASAPCGDEANRQEAMNAFNGRTALYQSYVSPSCLNGVPKGEEFTCGLANVFYRYTKTPLYIVESQYDTYQLYTSQGCPHENTPTVAGYIKMYGEAMRNSTNEVAANTNKKDGLFVASCLTHVMSGKILIKGKSFVDILGDWFFERGQLTEYHQLVEDCSSNDGLPCNAFHGCMLS